MSMMKPFVLLVLLGSVIPSCNPAPDVPTSTDIVSVQETAITVNPGTVTATSPLSPSPSTTPTIIPRIPTQTPTLPPSPAILEIFPLHVGLTKVYSVTMEYLEYKDGQDNPAKWTGLVTETITSLEIGYSWRFRAKIEGYPTHTESAVMLENKTKTYRVKENTISGSGFLWQETVQWPIEVGQEWGDLGQFQPISGWYVWRVANQEDIETPAGRFEDCYQIVYFTNPDHVILWLCPGVGIAREESGHHGSLDSLFLELQSVQEN